MRCLLGREALRNVSENTDEKNTPVSLDYVFQIPSLVGDFESMMSFEYTL